MKENGSRLRDDYERTLKNNNEGKDVSEKEVVKSEYLLGKDYFVEVNQNEQKKKD